MWRGEPATYLRWDTFIISMGGSSFPRSPLNAKHLPGNHNRQREGEGGLWKKAGHGIFPHTCEETDWSHLHLVAGLPGFISFAGAERANCRQLILTSCFNPCFTFTQSRHPPNWHYAGHQGAPLNKTRITFRWSYMPKEVLTWFLLRTLRKLACLKCAELSVGKRVGGWPLTVSSGL